MSDIDGVVVLEKKNIPGGKETTQKVLAPVQKYQRKLPFLFMSNGGGCSEQQKADKMNAQMGLASNSYIGSLLGGSGPKLAGNDIILCHSILRDAKFQDRF